MKALDRIPALTRPMAPLFSMLWVLSRRAFILAYRHNQFGIAKGAAYSALLSFFPLLATAATVLVRVRAEFVSDAIYDFLSQILPPGTGELVFYYFAIRGQQPVFLPVTGMLLSIWAASSLVASLLDGFEAAYRIPAGRPFLRERGVAILMVFSTALLVLGASVLVLFGSHAEHWVASWLGLAVGNVEPHGWAAVAGSITRYLIALGAIVAGASILYYFGPNRPQRWRLVWPGAVFATLLWFGATLLFAWYVRNIAHYNVMYGSIATVILLLVWMYLLAVIAFAGCEFNAEYERIQALRDRAPGAITPIMAREAGGY